MVNSRLLTEYLKCISYNVYVYQNVLLMDPASMCINKTYTNMYPYMNKNEFMNN